MKKLITNVTILLFYILSTLSAQAAAIRGKVTDENNDPLIGATVRINKENVAVTTDIDGNFEIPGLKNGKYSISAEYVFYKTITKDITLDRIADITFSLPADSRSLQEVVVTAEARRNTEGSVINLQRNSLVLQTGVSAQQIIKTQDRDASEVIKRVPGISIIDDKFVMVRGLSQRYNNVWINNSAVPSSEADARAFSFDIIPSSQLDNMIIIKSPAPEYPSDFSGGFVLVNTKDIPTGNSFKITLGGNINDQTHFSNFQEGKTSGTDFLGFDNGLRSLSGGIHSSLSTLSGDKIDILGNKLNNDWIVRNSKPVSDLSLSSELSHRWIADGGETVALLAAVNYGNNYRTYLNMENSLFGAYDTQAQSSTYLRHSRDNQYNHNVRLGAMLNLTYLTPSGMNRYEFKNIFNQIGRDRYTERVGVSAQSDNEKSSEYFYSSRTTYNGQFTGRHSLGDVRQLDWSAGYAYANNCVPDRKQYLINDALETDKLGLSNANEINREFTRLDEHIFSVNANYKDQFSIGSITPLVNVGAYSEYRTRTYDTRYLIYAWDTANNNLPSGFRYFDIPTQLLCDGNYGADRLYMLEKVKWGNNYSGNNLIAAGYLGVNIPIDRLGIYAGVRFEHSKMELISNVRDYEKSPRSLYYPTDDFFPSLNISYKLTDIHQFRASYGRTINRPEFREVSPSVYYDFDLASNVQGNYDLKSAYIDNVDLKYEMFPSSSELVSVSLFYKKFKNPIEWTYTVNGGTDLTYSYVNAKGADSYGVEVEIKKSLDFIGLNNFSLNFNGALIKSKVNFEEGSKNRDRAMQGQSPYLVNLGVFYRSDKLNLNVAALYNRIGKRIVGVGRSLGNSDNVVNIPDSYEMPRNNIDLSASKGFGQRWELKLSIRNILSEKVSYKQFVETGTTTIEEITRQYNPGRNFSINVSYKF